jgi:acetyltransferase-like isoleucine patch superfamily enzyme
MKKVFNIIKERPFSVPFILFNKLVCSIRSAYYSRKIDNGGGKIIITKPFLSFKIIKGKGAHIYIKGNFSVVPFVEGKNKTVIKMQDNSKLRVNGDFTVGDGVRFFLDKNASLEIGGMDKESGSGITSNSLIMVNKNIVIGKDFLCAWNVLISDSNWHSIKGQHHQGDVIIGNHVWISNSSSVLKGAVIGNNSIIASNSKIINKEYTENSMIAGIPSKVIRTGVVWSRDMIDLS